MGQVEVESKDVVVDTNCCFDFDFVFLFHNLRYLKKTYYVHVYFD